MAKQGSDTVTVWRDRLLSGERRALAKLITLSESPRRSDRELVSEIVRRSPPPPLGLRLGVTGPPGAGKSTLIETLGRSWLEANRKLAVLTIDPSSPRSGGSLLADKTRMPLLSTSSQAFVRPSPAKEELGGISRGTARNLRLCELAGYDPVVIESVGVGQNEIELAELVDCMVLVLTPSGGDEWQGIKRGITEVCDVIVVNKADENAAGAERLRAEYERAMKLLRADESEPSVLRASATTGVGITELLAAIDAVWQVRKQGPAQHVREGYVLREFRRGLEDKLRWLLQSPALRSEMAELEGQLQRGEIGLEHAIERAWERLCCEESAG